MAQQWIYHDNGATTSAKAHRRLGVGALLNRSEQSSTTPDALRPRKGVKPGTGSGQAELKVTPRGTGANMSVDVQPGTAYITSTLTQQGAYTYTSDAVVNIPITAANPTNPRIDRIGILVDDATEGGSTNTIKLVAIAGTPAGSPTAPAEPDMFLTLATVTVAANATNIMVGQITDARVYTAALGGLIATTFANVPQKPVPGQVLYLTDWRFLVYWNHNTGVWDMISPYGFTSTYSPVLFSQTVSVNLGNGGVTQGAWRFLNFNTVSVYTFFKFGTSGFNRGSGNYNFTLPFSSVTGNGFHMTFKGYLMDNNNNYNYNTVAYGSPGTAQTGRIYSYDTNGNGSHVSADVPATFSSNWEICHHGIYRFF